MMSFSEETVKELSKKLDPANVKQRSQGGISLSYVEGWHVIAEANRIFGHDAWHRETVYCKEVSREKNQKGNYVVGYEAKVRITVSGVVRDGTGLGSGIAKSLFDAIEGAAKEAETDAMKRALMTFGNPFGLALYDKARANVGAPFDLDAEHERIKKALLDFDSFNNLTDFWRSERNRVQEIKAFDNVKAKELVNIYTNKKATFDVTQEEHA